LIAATGAAIDGGTYAMSRLTQFQTVASAAGVAIGVSLSSGITRWLGPKGAPDWLSLALHLLAVGLTYLIFRIIADSLIENSKPLRRLLLGNRFVEGAWIDLVQSSDDSKFVSVVHVAFEAQSLRLSGQNFDLSGQPRGSFRSVMVVIDWPVLKYKYEWAARGPKRPSEGFGEICFGETEGPPVLLQGFFVDVDDGLRRTLWGKKIKDLATLAALRNPESLPDVVRAFVSESGPNVGAGVHVGAQSS
jgi:hypothetical protein